MTSVQITSTCKKLNWIPISAAKTGKWYTVRKYEHNHALIGLIGVCSEKLANDPIIITPQGESLSHRDLILEEIPNVYIQVQF